MNVGMEMNEIEWMWLAMGMYAVGCLMTSDSQRNANCGSGHAANLSTTFSLQNFQWKQRECST